MSQTYDWMLDEHIMTAVSDAYAQDNPITVGRGPGYDKALKGAMHVRGVHQSVICAHVKRMLQDGELHLRPVGTHIAYLGERPVRYPMVAILPV